VSSLWSLVAIVIDLPDHAKRQEYPRDIFGHRVAVSGECQEPVEEHGKHPHSGVVAV
jgi:hypothetical protein